MRAIVQTRYGSPDLLELREVDVPGNRADEVLVRVHAASMHPDVWHVVRGWPYVLRLMGSGLRRPRHRVPGTDLAGVVVAAGRDAAPFRPGDEVFGETLRGIQWRNGGALAEYAVAPASALAPKPAGLSFVEAAVVPTSGLIALQNVRVTAGQRVLVNGAGGGVGVFALQIARAAGAHVTGVDGPGKQALLRSLADVAVDYTAADFTRGDERYDVIVDIPGNRPFDDVARVLSPDGRYVLIGHDGYGTGAGRWFGSIPRVFKLIARSAVDPRLRGLDFSTPDKRAGLAELSRLIEAGQLRPVVDRTFPLEEVADAIRYLESGEVCGKVAIALT
jgi:NADPH:quinone reductase-like Zn-dependent oxidoreductase